MITPIVPHAGPASTLKPLLRSLNLELPLNRPLIGDDSGRLKLAPIRGIVIPGPGRGFAANANRLAKRVRTPWILLLNNDVALHVGWGRQITRRLPKLNRKVGLIATTVWRRDGKLDSIGDTFSWLLARPLKRGHGTMNPLAAAKLPLLSVSGAVMLVRREAWEQLRGLDESFGQYYEDVDFGWRALARRWQIAPIMEANSTHAGGLTYRRETRAYFGARNSLWLLRRHLPSEDALLERAVKTWRWRARTMTAEEKAAVEEGLVAGLSDQIERVPRGERAGRILRKTRLRGWQEAYRLWRGYEAITGRKLASSALGGGLIN